MASTQRGNDSWLQYATVDPTGNGVLMCESSGIAKSFDRRANATAWEMQLHEKKINTIDCILSLSFILTISRELIGSIPPRIRRDRPKNNISTKPVLTFQDKPRLTDWCLRFTEGCNAIVARKRTLSSWNLGGGRGA